ncbi:MAG: CcmD family protein [Cytophagales bacterium]|nr:CcmD family protein [Cytophagales bacterium]
MFRTIFISLMLLLGRVSLAVGQDGEMANQFRADGKIYVVVAVMLVLLVGIIFYLFRIERKIKKLEE